MLPPVCGVDLAKIRVPARLRRCALASRSNRIASRARSSSAGSTTARSRWSSWKPAARPTTGRAGCTSLGIEVRLLPAALRSRLRQTQQDRCGRCRALLEAARCADIMPVRVKSDRAAGAARPASHALAVDGTRTSRINALRGFCREFGIVIAQGARARRRADRPRARRSALHAVPTLFRRTDALLVEEIRLLEVRIAQLETQLAALARQSPACTTLLSIPGVGLLTATAMVAATCGEVSHFNDARHFAAWFGLTPKEHSSGSTRHLGRISKRGDRYLRMLLTHGARSVLRAASVAQRSRQAPSIRCATGRSPCSSAAITTRPPARSPTSSRASATRRCAISEPYGAARLTHRRSRARASRCPPEQPHIHSPQPCTEIDRPSWHTRVAPTPLDADNYCRQLHACRSQRLAQRCRRFPCRHGPHSSHFRCRIYDCRRTLLCRQLSISLLLAGGVHIRC